MGVSQKSRRESDKKNIMPPSVTVTTGTPALTDTAVKFKESANIKWDFDKHCTKQIPQVYTKEDFGYEGKDFVLTKPFKILTDEAVEILRSIILHDPNLPKYCRF